VTVNGSALTIARTPTVPPASGRAASVMIQFTLPSW
jgi:hypothetical protein